MDVDDSAVDLSVRSLPPELSELRALTASGLTITPAQPPPHGASGKRVLRPRSEQRSYAESPDIVLLPAAPPHRKPNLPAPAPFTDVSSKLNAGVNVSITPSTLPVAAPESPREPRDDDESEEDENDPPLPIAGHRELSSAEIWERERHLRALREKLRAEETRLVLLRKLRQSQQTTGIPPAKNKTCLQDTTTGTALAGSGCVVPPGVTVTPAPPPAHQQNKRSSTTGTTGNNLASSARRPSSLPGGATLTPGPYRSQSSASGGASITPSVTITPAPPPTTQHAQPKASSRSSDDTQTPAQRQAAAKLALRKQLEKTLLQIPPPKPPPPEMNFIPSPSNTDFVYLVGLEHVVDYLTNEERMPRSSVPAVCAQCGCDFTAVWRWERSPPHAARRQDATFSCAPAARRLCELCVSGNVKRALKAEHTARLKTAFVRALQQEQEIERRLAAPAPSPPPAPPPAHAPTPAHAHNSHSSHPHRAQQMSVSRSSSRTPAPTTPAAPTPQPTTTKPPQSSNSNRSLSGAESMPRSHHSERAREAEVPAKKGSSSSTASQGSSSSKQHQQLAAAAAAQMAFEQHSAAAMQALQHQLLRGLSGAAGSGGMSAAAAAAMMQFSPLLYTYQLAMAQASALGKRSSKGGNSGNTAAMAAEMQRMAEAQRQYLLDMIPGQHGRNPWTKN
ncbi:transcriptional repressor p66-beta-like isoform X2 [Battus philenor]|uniref:transcriptional repressor p66-beta-like isoform X2 n=1 Tax=Battus philenor TaxID=42288 RepID=UPI0035CEC73E